MENQEIIVKSVVDLWNSKIKETSELIDRLSDEQLQAEISAGKNRGQYLVGHLTAVNDRMLPLFGFGPSHYPQYDEMYLRNADRAVEGTPSVQELRKSWKASVERLAEHFAKQQTADWFNKHTAVTEEDFKKEPHRNKLNVLMGRTTHLTYHTGQLALLKK